LFVFTFCKSSINPITNPNPTYSHPQSRDNIKGETDGGRKVSENNVSHKERRESKTGLRKE
jgi:hypothetical protein